ncbi:MAG: hypothetical protein JJU05_14605 [Verrucomicrobia bacterium]|nr:hypothetical protein [Verrucomicrobiota bacterium]MCH8528319.1 hypothetical protein [Kiritimatiellia bacterium]
MKIKPVEVLVVLLGLGILVGLIVPMFTTSTGVHQAQLRMLYNGRHLYQAVFSAMIEDLHKEPAPNYWADSGNPDHGGTSTGYFRHLMSIDVLPHDFGLFAAPGIQRADDLNAFSAEHNAWAAVSFEGNSGHRFDSGTPVFISRNLNESRLKDGTSTTRDRLQNVGRGEWETPFADRWVIVVRVGGGGQILRVRDAPTWQKLNPTDNTLLILQP